jgi:hypothetical protein
MAAITTSPITIAVINVIPSTHFSFGYEEARDAVSHPHPGTPWSHLRVIPEISEQPNCET